jgi:hypothetical protein
MMNKNILSSYKDSKKKVKENIRKLREHSWSISEQILYV